MTRFVPEVAVWSVLQDKQLLRAGPASSGRPPGDAAVAGGRVGQHALRVQAVWTVPHQVPVQFSVACMCVCVRVRVCVCSPHRP